MATVMRSLTALQPYGNAFCSLKHAVFEQEQEQKHKYRL